MEPRILVDGEQVGLGLRPRTAAPGAAAPMLSVQFDLLARHEWQPVDWSHHCPQVLHQHTTNMCTAFTVVAGVQATRKQNGMNFVPLSPANLYCRINGGCDGGAPLSYALEAAKKDGICTTNLVPLTAWQCGTPDGWQQEAANFKVLEFWDCPDVQHVATAVQKGMYVVTGIPVGANFRTNSLGYGPDFPQPPTGLHAVLVVGMRPDDDSDRWHFKIQNSWGETWGLKGFAYVHENYWRSTPITDGWCIRAVSYA